MFVSTDPIRVNYFGKLEVFLIILEGFFVVCWLLIIIYSLT